MILEIPAYIGPWSCQSAFLLRHTTSIDLFHIRTCSLFREGQRLSSHYHDDFEEWRFIWLDNVWLVILLSSMFALEMLTLGHNPLIDDEFCEMTVYDRHILPRDYLALRAYPFWEDTFILGHNHLTDFDIET